MTERDVTTMRRRDLAALHAQEMHAALFPYGAVPDDEITVEQKAAVAAVVRALVIQHRAELSAWQAAQPR